MSANNWAFCPKCSKSIEDLEDEQKAKLSAAYGKVSQAEYADLVSECSAPVSEPERTLREDYYLGIIEKNFEISYSASCSKCGFFLQIQIRRESN